MAGLEAIRNIMVVGMGGIGGLMGARLAAGRAAGEAGGPARGHRHLTFVARGAHLEAIRAGGLLLVSPDGSSPAPGRTWPPTVSRRPPPRTWCSCASRATTWRRRPAGWRPSCATPPRSCPC